MNTLTTKRLLQLRIPALAAVIAICALLTLQSEKIFTDVEVYYFVNSTIVQAFVALVAFLGSFVVFKIQLLENAMQLLRDQVAEYVAQSRGVAAHTYSPTEMMSACGEISSIASATPSQPIIEQTFNKMAGIHRGKNDIRKMMVTFVSSATINVAIALIGILFSPVLAVHWIVGGIFVSANVAFSVFNLYRMWQVMLGTLGGPEETVVLSA